MFVKVCGITNQENLTALEKVGVDRVGFIYYSKSSRNITTRLDSASVCRTGVFVNAGYQSIRKYVMLDNLDAVQLHGDESPAFCKLVKDMGVEVSKAVSIGEKIPSGLDKFEGNVDHLLFDTKGEQRGGNGQRFNWGLLDHYDLPTPVILSGGISPEHVEDVAYMQRRYPFIHGVDLNSGFEVSPGLKDVELAKEFINQLKK